MVWLRHVAIGVVGLLVSGSAAAQDLPAMLEHEVTPVLTVLRAKGLNIVSIHHHMTNVKPMVVFLHYYGTGPAAVLAQGIRAAVDLLGKTPVTHR